MPPESFIYQRSQHGMNPAEYRRHFEQEVEKVRAETEASKDDHVKYLPLNLARTLRIEKTYSPSDAVKQAASAIRQPQLWMILTEPWCGDSAQNLPCIFKIAACSSVIDIRVLLRDQNLDIMDSYLTNGTRGIPKLVAFDSQGGELFRWGPRPQAAARLFGDLLESGVPVQDVREKLHLWYAKDRGRALEREFVALLKDFS